jgi:hypothetical protein
MKWCAWWRVIGDAGMTGIFMPNIGGMVEHTATRRLKAGWMQEAKGVLKAAKAWIAPQAPGTRPFA